LIAGQKPQNNNTLIAVKTRGYDAYVFSEILGEGEKLDKIRSGELGYLLRQKEYEPGILVSQQSLGKQSSIITLAHPKSLLN